MIVEKIHPTRQIDVFRSCLFRLNNLTIHSKGIVNACISDKGLSVFLDINEHSFVEKAGCKYVIHHCQRVCDEVQLPGLYSLLNVIHFHQRPYPGMAKSLENEGYKVLMNEVKPGEARTGFIIGKKFRIIYN